MSRIYHLIYIKKVTQTLQRDKKISFKKHNLIININEFLKMLFIYLIKYSDLKWRFM